MASLFTQQARKDLIAIYGRDSEIVIAFRDAILAQRKARVGYWFGAELRNNLLHFGLPVSSQRVN